MMFKKIWLLLGSIFFSIGLLLGVITVIVFAVTTGSRNRVISDSIPTTAVIVLLPLALTFGIIGASFLIVHVRKKKRHRWLRIPYKQQLLGDNQIDLVGFSF